MKFKFTKRIVALILVLVSIVACMSAGFNVTAAEMSDAQRQEVINKINELQNKSNDIQKKINEQKNQLNNQNAVKESYEAQIAITQQKIDACNEYIAMCNNQIAESETKIAAKNAAIEDTKERFKKRIRSLYNSNTDSSLQLLLGAESFSEFLALAELTQCISAQDKMLVDEIVATISEIQAEIAKNEEIKTQQAEIKKTLAAEKAVLDQQVASVNSVISKINSTKKDLEAEQRQFEADKKKLEDSLLSVGVDNRPFDGKFLWPVPGFPMTCPFMSNDSVHKGNHKGIDLGSGGINGKDILCSATGTVTKVVNYCTHNYGKSGSCGCGGGYGNYVQVSHGIYQGEYYATIYAHMRKAIVSSGQQVSRGQVLGYVGSTGWSTGWHLHFGVARGTNPNSLNWEDPMKFSYSNR